MPPSIQKALKNFLISSLFLIFCIGVVFAEENSDKIPEKYLEENPEINPEKSIEKKPEESIDKAKSQQACKPDICGEIIFDPTSREVHICLKDALGIVIEKNFDVKIFAQRKIRDKWLAYQAASEWLPDLQGQFEIQRLQGEFLVSGILPDVLTEVPVRTRLLYTYEINARKWFAVKEAYYNYQSAGQEFEFSKDEVLLEASRRYYELLQARINIEILKTNVKQIEEQFKINQQKVAAGVGTQFDVLRAEADRDNAIQRLLRAENTYRFAQAQLANVLGLPVFIQLVPFEHDLIVKEIFCDCFDIEKACNYAMCSRNDLCAQKFDIKAARQRVNSGYSIYLPEFTIFGQVAEAGTTSVGVSGNSSIGLLIDWFALQNLGLKGYTEVKAQKAALAEEKLLFITQSRDIQENLVRAFSDVITEKQLIDSTFKELEAASATREISLVRLKEGLGSFLDVIQTQLVYTESRLDNLDAITKYNISQIELLFEMGVISEENILYGFNSGVLKQNPNAQNTAEYNRKILKEIEELKKDEEATKQQK